MSMLPTGETQTVLSEWQSSLPEGDLRQRFSVRPGITGYAQANFRNSITQEQKFHWDAFYATHQSLLLDMKIIYKTIFSVIARKNINSTTNS